MAMVTYSVFPSPSSSSSSSYSSSSSSLDSPLLLRRSGLPTIWTPFLSNETLPLLKTNKCHQLRGKQAETKWSFLPFLRCLEGGNDQRWSLGLVKFRLDHLNKSTWVVRRVYFFTIITMSDDDEWWWWMMTWISLAKAARVSESGVGGTLRLKSGGPASNAWDDADEWWYNHGDEDEAGDEDVVNDTRGQWNCWF